MVKVTGGGRGMAAIAAHFRYIAKAGRLPFENDRGVVEEGKEALRCGSSGSAAERRQSREADVVLFSAWLSASFLPALTRQADGRPGRWLHSQVANAAAEELAAISNESIVAGVAFIPQRAAKTGDAV